MDLGEREEAGEGEGDLNDLLGRRRLVGEGLLGSGDGGGGCGGGGGLRDNEIEVEVLEVSG